MRRIALTAVCVFLASTPAMAQSKAAIQKLSDEWAAAFNKGDAVAVAAMYTVDAYVLPDHAEMAHGHAAIESLIKKLIGNYQNDLKLSVVDVQSLGPGALRAIGTYSITVKSLPPQQEAGKFAIVERKVSGKWLIATDIWNSNK